MRMMENDGERWRIMENEEADGDEKEGDAQKYDEDDW